MSKKGTLLVNLGSPDSPESSDVRRYLDEFLNDPRVIDIPAAVRRPLVSLGVAPLRAPNSAEAYEEVWTDEGSPLILITESVAESLRQRVDGPVEIGMRYGNPSIKSGVRELVDRGVDELFLIPLYPHYAMSSYETVVAKTRDVIDELGVQLDLTVQPPFYDDPDYIDALLDSAEEYLQRDFDMLLFSYHGVPVRHIKKGDPSGTYCLQDEDCCRKANPAHGMCYRHQCHATTWAFCEKAGIPPEKYNVAFQSRVGPDAWLEPFTADELERMPSAGIDDVLVMCPAFVSDCLETIEEIGMEGRETFLEAGGDSFDLIPCLNDNEAWIDVLNKFIDTFESGELEPNSAHQIGEPTEIAH
jgi:ferrochelatase